MLGIKSHKLSPTLFLEGCSIPTETGWKSQGVRGQGGQWDREVDHLDFQAVSGEDDHPEVRLSAICSGNSYSPPSPPCATVLALALSSCFFQGQLLMLKPTEDLSPLPQVPKETVFVASLNRLGKVVPMVPSSISKSWTQILFSWCDYAAWRILSNRKPGLSPAL